MELKEINAKKRVGDYYVAAQMLGLSKENLRRTLKRPKAKRHASVAQAMAKVIAAREALLEVSKKNVTTEG